MAGLRGEQVVVGRVEPLERDVVPDGEQVAGGVVEEPEVHRVGEPARPAGRDRRGHRIALLRQTGRGPRSMLRPRPPGQRRACPSPTPASSSRRPGKQCGPSSSPGGSVQLADRWPASGRSWRRVRSRSAGSHGQTAANSSRSARTCPRTARTHAAPSARYLPVARVASSSARASHSIHPSRSAGTVVRWLRSPSAGPGRERFRRQVERVEQPINRGRRGDRLVALLGEPVLHGQQTAEQVSAVHGRDVGRRQGLEGRRLVPVQEVSVVPLQLVERVERPARGGRRGPAG